MSNVSALHDSPAAFAAVADLLASQDETFKVANRLAVRTIHHGSPEMRDELASLIGMLADQYEQMSQVADQLRQLCVGKAPRAVAA